MRIFLAILLLTACGGPEFDLQVLCSDACPGAETVQAFPPAQCQCFCSTAAGQANLTWLDAPAVGLAQMRTEWTYALTHGCHFFP